MAILGGAEDRDTNLAQGTTYQALPRDEIQVADEADVHDEATPSSSAEVQNLDEWHAMSEWRQFAIHAIFSILGAAVLLPFNAVITPSEFYRTLLRDTTHEDNFMSWIIIAYNVASIVFGAHATTSMASVSLVARIRSSMAAIIITFFVAIILAAVVAHSSTPKFDIAFSAVILLTLIVAAAASYLQVAIVTLSNAFGPTFLGTMLTGQGLVGVIVSVVQLVTAYANTGSAQDTQSQDVQLMINKGEANAALWFFCANTVFVAGAFACFWYLHRTNLFTAFEQHGIRSSRTDQHTHQTQGPRGSIKGIRRYLNSRLQASYDRIMHVQQKVLLACLAIAYIFIVTLAVFPALTSRVRPISTDAPRDSILIFVAWHFLVFNSSDLLGRSLPTIAPGVFRITHMGFLAAGCLLRTVLIPLLAACNYSSSTPGPATSGASKPSSFGTPIFFSLIAVLGFSNGLLATNVFIVGPRHPSFNTDDQRNTAAGLLSWWLTFGLAIGSLVSFWI